MRHAERDAYNVTPPCHSGKGFPLVSGAKGSANSPIKNTAHIVTPAERMGNVLSMLRYRP
jgi:hypothetical protein